MRGQAARLAHDLAQEAEAVCRTYLSNGRREGRYWTVGDVANERGRSLYVRLTGPACGKGAVGRWTDAATGQHGDLLDLIRLNRGLDTVREAMDEARLFLSLPSTPDTEPAPPKRQAPRGSPEAARRLFASGRRLRGTPAERYLRARGLALDLDPLWSLRFHPACWHRPGDDGAGAAWPALLAAVTDPVGEVRAVHRTWLDRARPEKAPLAVPRRSLGHQLGNGVRLGLVVDGVAAVGEGLETVLSLRTVMPRMGVVAALSAAHLAALSLPPGVRRLYVAEDADPAGRRAAERLRERAEAQGIEARSLSPREGGDFNADLSDIGLDGLAGLLRAQLAPEDAAVFLVPGPALEAAA